MIGGVTDVLGKVDDYLVFLQEHEDNIWLTNDPLNVHQTIKIVNSQECIDVMREEYKSMLDNGIWDLVILPEGAKYVWL